MSLNNFWWGDDIAAAFFSAVFSTILIALTAVALALYQGTDMNSNDNVHHSALPKGITMLQPSLYKINKGTNVSVCSDWATDARYNSDGSVVINCYDNQRWNVPYHKPHYTPWSEFGEAVWIFWAAWGGVGVLALADAGRINYIERKRKKHVLAINRREALEKELGIGV